jgi:hypothetical protein
MSDQNNFIASPNISIFGEISSSNLVEPMKVFDPKAMVEKFEKDYKKKKKEENKDAK